ncbi:hypothetical protein [Kitasatospora sp. NPDC089509]|uniref:hypothetical protein n=1 Tax=Kitasatospora sp. NPDC089509 TaxID=3364079 RepID=UPI0037F7BE1D
MINVEEFRRVLSGPVDGEVPQSLISRITFAAENPGAVISRAREVMVSVFEGGRAPWPELESWRAALPLWFAEACAPERSPEQAQLELAAWRRLTQAERAACEPAWTLSGWVHWFDPNGAGPERGWTWWHAGAAGETGWIDVAVEDVPFTSGALLWLIAAAGGREVDSD